MDFKIEKKLSTRRKVVNGGLTPLFGKMLVIGLISVFFFFGTKTLFAQANSMSPTPTLNPFAPHKPPRATPVPLIFSKQKLHDELSETYKHPHKFKEMGLSGANLPEKYVRKVMFNVPPELIGKYGWPQNFTCRVDGKENVYLAYQRAVVVLDKTGKIIRAISKDGNQENGLLVDEQGDICIYSANIPTISSIYDPEGKLIDKPDFKDKFNHNDAPFLRLSNGIIYSRKMGTIIYKTQNADEKEIGRKKFTKDLKFQITGDRPTKYEADENGNWLPYRIDGFDFEAIVDVDDFGNVYADYETGSLGGEHPIWQLDRLFKFNPKFRLLAGFDFFPSDINLHTGDIYYAEKVSRSSPYGRMVKWEKPVRP